MRTEQETFDAQSEVGRIRSLRADARRRLFRKSRLDRYRAELVAMKRAGASCADLAVWLRITHRCKINRSSIDRYLKKLPELQEGPCLVENSEKSSCTRELADCVQKNGPMLPRQEG